jgi:hypothetical protein
MDDLHNETLMIPQAHVVVDLNVEFVEIADKPNDPIFLWFSPYINFY